MTDCVKCGACCENILLWFDPENIPDKFKNSENPKTIKDVEFISQHWHLIQGTQYVANCDMYDSESKLCTAHDDRPPVCEGYPWYGERPSLDHRNSKYLPPQCSFTTDIRQLLPIVGIK